jgi:hypothetical protein
MPAKVMSEGAVVQKHDENPCQFFFFFSSSFFSSSSLSFIIISSSSSSFHWRYSPLWALAC